MSERYLIDEEKYLVNEVKCLVDEEKYLVNEGKCLVDEGKYLNIYLNNVAFYIE